MILDVILGRNIDTTMWIHYLKVNNADQIVVLDYDYFGVPKNLDGILYLSNSDTKNYLKKFDTVNFYKSIYAYPGMRNK